METINIEQVRDTAIVKRMATMAGIGADADIQLPPSFNTETDKFLLFVNGDLWDCFATAVLGVGSYAYKGSDSTKIKPADAIAPVTMLTLVKIPGLKTLTSQFTDELVAETWV